MEKKTKRLILSSLPPGRGEIPKEQFLVKASADTYIPQGLLQAHVAVLEDQGLIKVRDFNGIQLLRLSYDGEKLFWNRKKDMLDFVSQNWMSLSGILIGIVAIIISVISLIKK